MPALHIASWSRQSRLLRHEPPRSDNSGNVGKVVVATENKDQIIDINIIIFINLDPVHYIII